MPMGHLPAPTQLDHLRVLATPDSMALVSLALVILLFLVCVCGMCYSKIIYLCFHVDADECTLGTDNCNSNAACFNTIGSFTCTCNSNFAGNGVVCVGESLRSFHFASFCLCLNSHFLCLPSFHFACVCISRSFYYFSCCCANCCVHQQHFNFSDLGFGFWCLVLWFGGH